MSELTITTQHALKAVLMGACTPPKVGRVCSKLPTSELIWAEQHEIASAEEIAESGGLPLWVRSGSGSGYGDGSGSGYGYGYGYGYGSGSGSGYGDGSGDGDGDGSGSGYGYGYGYGYGDGFGDGSGYGADYEDTFRKLKLIK